MESTEDKWRRERRELYAKLERSAESGLNRDAVLASRDLFAFDESGRAVPKQFAFQHEGDAVTVVCAEIPRSAALQWGGITRQVLNALRGKTRESCGGGATDLKDVYVSDQDIMHVTLFYTSHPDDLAPRKENESKSERIDREVTLLRELAMPFDPVRMTPVKVVLAASGAILLLLQCIQADDDSNDEQNRAFAGQRPLNAGRHAEFSVDLLRQEARETFPFVSGKSPTAIIHTTLARVLSPDAFDEAALNRVREVCHHISVQLASAGPNNANSFVVSKLWYVDETHFIRPTGRTTTISLGAAGTTEATCTLPATM